MRARTLTTVVGLVALASGLVACSSSKSSTPSPDGAGASSNATPTNTSTGSAGSTKVIKVGVLADLTGVASSGFNSTEKGIKAYVDALNKTGGISGQKIEYVMGDTASSPAGARTAAQKLVQNDKVFAIIEDSASFFGAQSYLLKAGIPVVGGGFDSLLWADPKQTNLFNSVGVTNYDDAPLATGQFFKAQGVTNCGAVGYGSTESSKKSVAGFKKSCEAAGLKTSYINSEVPFGSTDVGAIAIAIKNAGVDGLFYSTVPNTAFAANAALQQLGVKLKVASLPTGYGGDLLESPAAVAAAQGDFFTTVGLPAEANTPATQKREADFAAVGVSGPPTFAEQEAYIAMSAFVAGVKAAGADPTRDTFMAELRAVKDFDGDGLFAPQKIDFGNYRPSQVCNYYVQLEGKVFKNVTGSPYCAGVVPITS